MHDKSYTSGALAKVVGVSTDTLRHYERKGVLARPHRGPNGYRKYPPEALERLQLIRRGLTVGLTLDELAGILRIRDRGDHPCEEVRQLVALKLADVETRLKELKQLRNELKPPYRTGICNLRNAATVRELTSSGALDRTVPTLNANYRQEHIRKGKNENHYLLIIAGGCSQLRCALGKSGPGPA